MLLIPLKLRFSFSEFTFEAEMQGQKIDNVYKGTVEKDTMTGSVAIAGGQLSGTFTAKRK